MSRSKHWAWGILLLSLILAAIILVDGVPFLRGPRPDTPVWHWSYSLRPAGRLWAPAGAGLLMLVVAFGWLRSRYLREWMWLLLLSLITLLLQMGFIYADRPAVVAELIDRTLAVQTGGYFWTAAQIDDLPAALRSYPQEMRRFESDHARTHPPGLVLANWVTIELLQAQPALAAGAAAPARAARCTDLWLLNQPAAVAAALGIWGWLPLLLGATAVWPAYFLAGALHPPARRLAALLTAALPALLLFAPLPDQIFALLTLLIVLSFHQGLLQRRLSLLAVSGLLISAASFATLGSAVLILPLAAVGFWLRYQTEESRGRFWPRAAAVFGGAAAVAWLIYWVGWGVPPWEIALAGMAEHAAATASQRDYFTWLWANPLDFIIFTGLPVFIGFGGLLFTRGDGTRAGRDWALAAAALLLLLNLSGSTRGEVGRIWLFLMPLLAVSAAIFYAARTADWRAQTAVLAGQVVLAVALGVSWQPVAAVIVRATPPERPYHPSAAQLAAATPQGTTFGEQLRLGGYQWNGPDYAPGDALRLTLYWELIARAARPYTVFVHLVGPDGTIVAQQDNWPVEGAWPPTCWTAGEQISDPYQLPLPADMSTGMYQLRVGLYDAQNGVRLLTPDGRDAVSLPPVSVRGD